jgi:hypothetical protein
MMGFLDGERLMTSPKRREESFENCTSSRNLTKAQPLKNKITKSVRNTNRYRLNTTPRSFHEHPPADS